MHTSVVAQPPRDAPPARTARSAADVTESRLQKQQRAVSLRTQKAQQQEAKEEARAVREEKPTAAKRLATRLVTLIELGGVALVIHLLRKPLKKFVDKVGEEVYKGVHVIEKGLKGVNADIVATELRIRADIRKRYFEDPILSHKLGPGLYRELIQNAEWDTTIHHPDGSYPGAVADQFVAGTGRGATTLRGAIAHGISLQVLGLSKWFIGNGANLQKVGHFPLLPGVSVR